MKIKFYFFSPQKTVLKIVSHFLSQRNGENIYFYIKYKIKKKKEKVVKIYFFYFLFPENDENSIIFSPEKTVKIKFFICYSTPQTNAVVKINRFLFALSHLVHRTSCLRVSISHSWFSPAWYSRRLQWFGSHARAWFL